ncbi:Ig-like domain-containing protein, partial [Comamonas sp.]|uniref:Ig-like domain-containing protein n=1 Tax=Comamonas sp. TaxID=34028 RepID=UPI002FC740A5
MNQSPSIASKEIVFVFDNLTDWQTLVAAAPEGAELVVLDGNRDGLQQIAGYLNGRSGIDAIHLLSHGSGGTAELGNMSLSAQNIGQYSQTLDAIGAALANDGDILIYGCYSGKGPQGAALLGELARLTQADIAASNNATGAADQGGDWQLELHVGEVGTASLSASAYRNLLVTPSDQFFNSEFPRNIPNTGETLAGLTYSMVSPTETNGAVVALTESSNTSITGAGDLGMMFNYDGVTYTPGAVDARIASADGTEFRIVSMEIDAGNDLGASSQLTITGYRDGVAVATNGFNTGISQSTGSVTYAKNAVSPGFGGTLTFNSDWNYIDEIRFTGFNTIITIDNLDFDAGIPPDNTPPSVTGVSSITPNGTYKVGSAISVQVSFSENVFVDSGTPQLTLETGSTDRTINYTSGSGTSTLTFSYTVQAGDTSADLDYLATSALALNGGTISDAAGNAATLTLPFPGAAHSLGANNAIVIDGVVPTVTSVNSSVANGTYKIGDAIVVQINFSEAVTVNGTPQLTLETGSTDRTINFASGSGTSTLTFSYTVQAGDTSADLDYLATSALALNGGTISDAAGNAATLTLPFPGAANSLGANKNIVIDGVVPTVSSVNSSSANGTYKIGDAISVQVNFSEVVTVNGTPQLTLETGRTINYTSGSGSSALTFSYTVQAGDSSADLDYLATSALALNGGTIRDAAGNAATLTLPFPGAANSLGANNAIVIDGVVPAVSSINSSTANGTYKIGDAISVQINFSEDITVNGTPQLALETGTTDRAINYASGSGTSTLTFSYTVQAGDISADLDFTSTAALSLAGGTLRDTAGNDAVLTLPAPGSAGSLGANKNIVIDGVAPTLTITSGASTLKIGDTTTITFTFSEDPGSSFTWDGSPGDVEVSGGTLSAITGSGLTRTATFTPTAGTNAGTASITVASGSYTDIAGNSGSSGMLTGLTFDTLAPAVSAPTLNSASDSGISSTDHITSVSTPDIEGSAEAFSTVTLYDTDGTTVLGSTAADLLGNWSITSISLSEGTHFLSTRATDMAGNTSLASSALMLTIDTSVATPSAPDLLQASDSGISSFDNITNVTTPTLTGTADVDSSVTLYHSDGVTVLGTTLADGGGVWSITSNALAEGTHTLTAKATDVAGNVSAASAGLTVTIDATPPAAAPAPNLDAGSDSGASDSDNITYVSTPLINGTAEANSTVTLYDTGGTTVLGITVANPLGDWSITSSTLTQGTHNLTIKATDTAGNVSAASAALSVTIDSDAPVFSSARVNGSTLVLSYTDVDTLDAANLLDPAAFTVMVGQLPNAVTAAAVNAIGKTVTLTLATPVAHGQVVTVAYDDPSPLDDMDALQDLAGNDAATLAATAVTNTTPAPNPGTPTTPTDPVPVPVDGVPVTTAPGDGGT